MVLAVAMLSAGSTLVKWTETSGAVLAAWRLALAAALWWAVIVVQHRRRGTPYPSRHAWRAALPAGLCFGADLALFFTALTRTSIAHAEFIGSMTPLLVVPLGMVVFGERPNLMALPFGLVTLAGLAAFISTGGSSGAATTGGDLLAVLALMCWAAYLAFSRRARATVGVTDFMATVLPIGLVVALPAALVQAGDEMWPLSTRTWVAVVAMSVLTGVVGHGLIASAQRLIDVGTISVIHVGQPAIAVMWAWVVLGERVALVQLPGAALDHRRPRRLHAAQPARLRAPRRRREPGRRTVRHPDRTGVTPTPSTWWSSPASIRGPSAFQADALPTELLDRVRDDLPERCSEKVLALRSRRDLNPRPPA